MEELNQLGTEKINKLLLQFSLPAIIGMMVNALYNVIDRVFIGNGVGRYGLAGITISFPIMIFLMAFGMLIGIGSTTLISLRLGEQKKEAAEAVLGNCFTLLVVGSIVLGGLGLLFIEPLLKLFGASKMVLPYAKQYLTVILLGTPLQGIGFGMNNIIRADGKPKLAMITMLIGALLNAAFCPVFIFWLGWGITGAGVATVTAQGIAALWVLSYFLGGKSNLKLTLPKMRLRWQLVSSIILMGLAPFLMQIAASFINIILNQSLVKYGGDQALAAMGLVSSLLMLIVMPIFGINQGMQPIIGYNYGAKNYGRVKETLWIAIIAATGIVLLGYVAVMFFPTQMLSVFGKKDQELIELGSRALRIFLIMLPVIGFQIIGASYFQGVGKAPQAMFLSLTRQVVLLIPALLILPRFFGLNGVFYAGPTADFGSALLTGIWLFFELRKLEEQHQTQLELQPQLEGEA